MKQGIFWNKVKPMKNGSSLLKIFVIAALVPCIITGCKPKHKEKTGVPDTDIHGAAQQSFPPPPTSGMEFTSKLMINFVERVNRQQGWMDGKFVEIDNSPISYLMGDSYTTIDAAFTIEDKNGDLFKNCLVSKQKYGDVLLQLKQGDHIRITGQAVSMATSEEWINVDSIQVLK
jgi:hypothetical protein